MQMNKKILGFWLLYSAFTISCFQFGPYYNSLSLFDYVKLYTFLIFVHLFIIGGYFWGCREGVLPGRKIRFFERNVTRIVYIGFVGSLIEVFLRLFMYRGTIGLAEARSAWHDAGGSLSSHLILLIGGFTLPTVAILFSRWRSLSIFCKIAGLSVIFIKFATAVMGGTRHGIFITAIIVGLLFLGGIYAGRIRIPRILVYVFAVLCALAFMSYASIVNMSRYGMDVRDVSIEELQMKQGRYGTIVDPNNIIMVAPIPNYIKPALVSGTYYFGHGYGALTDCLSLPFRPPSLGLGHSLFLTRNAYKVGLGAIVGNSYAVRLNNQLGYNIPQTWMTCYPWLASDLTFPGTVIFLGFLGALFSKAWNGYLRYSDLYATLALVWLINIFFQLPLLFPGQDYVPLIVMYGSIGVFIYSQRGARNS
jgi:uncharacterized membrane protein YobD (UPF0266 family)